MTDDRGPKSPLPWRQRRTPERGTRRAKRWRRVYPGYVFPGTAWTVTQGPYKRIKRSKVKSWITARCGYCKQEFERRLDHMVAGKSHC